MSVLKLPWTTVKNTPEPLSRGSLKEMYRADVPEFVVDAVYDSFFVGAIATLSHYGKAEFNTALDWYAGHLLKLESLSETGVCERSRLLMELENMRLTSMLKPKECCD